MYHVATTDVAAREVPAFPVDGLAILFIVRKET